MTRQRYEEIWDDSQAVRAHLEAAPREAPEIFPAGIEQGFRLTGREPESLKMPGIRLRQLRLATGGVFWLRPSFVMPYMTGTTDETEHPLRLMDHGVPGWLIAEKFGHVGSFWDRHVARLGRNSLVGTTVKDPQQLRQNLVADEHHTQ